MQSLIASNTARVARAVDNPRAVRIKVAVHTGARPRDDAYLKHLGSRRQREGFGGRMCGSSFEDHHRDSALDGRDKAYGGSCEYGTAGSVSNRDRKFDGSG